MRLRRVRYTMKKKVNLNHCYQTCHVNKILKTYINLHLCWKLSTGFQWNKESPTNYCYMFTKHWMVLHLYYPITRNRAGDRTFTVYASKLWNNLPKTLGNSNSVNASKKHLKLICFKINHVNCSLLCFYFLCMFLFFTSVSALSLREWCIKYLVYVYIYVCIKYYWRMSLSWNKQISIFINFWISGEFLPELGHGPYSAGFSSHFPNTALYIISAISSGQSAGIGKRWLSPQI